MIKISGSEAIAYDALSILSVKSEKRPEIRVDWDRLMAEIVEQVDPVIHAQIMAQIYPVMWAVNSAIFNEVDKVSKDDPVKNLNDQRFQLKLQLQRRFFPEKPLTEQKIERQ